MLIDYYLPLSKFEKQNYVANFIYFLFLLTPVVPKMFLFRFIVVRSKC